MAINPIIQITKQRIESDEYITEEYYYDGFVGTIADYVDDEIDRDKGIEVFKQELGSAASFDTVDSFKIADKKAFFRGKFMQFQECLRIMNIYTLDQFSGDIPSDIELDFYKLKKSYAYEFGTYIDFEGDTLTLDKFLRNADTNATYYIGGIVNYHC